MPGMNEANTIQAALIGWAEDMGWEHIPGMALPRLPELTDVVIDEWAREALLVLNPDLVGDPENADAVLAEVARAALLAHDGLVAANERLTVMLRGEHAFKTLDGKHVPRRFIDFDDLENNRFVVSDEVTIKGGSETRRLDVVYYVNGFPLVVAETKTPVQQDSSWVTGAKDIWGTYEVEYPQFFAPNVFSVATDGRQLRLAPVRTEPSGDPNEDEGWGPWGSTTDDLAQTQAERVARSAELLLTPGTVLRILKDYAMYRAGTAADPTMKILPRYAQLEAAEAIHAKVLTGKRVGQGGGLIWQHQGSGKTELSAFTASRLLRDKLIGNPTVILIAHRKQLVRQAADLFATTGMPRVVTPVSKRELWKAVKNHRGVIVTTVHKFAEAGFLSDRDNIIVLVDEAHDSQEGDFGKAWRTAVPNATFFGMTGTAVKQGDRNTFALFGDPADENFILSRYTPERSIADGYTKPVVVEARRVGFDLDKEDLDKAFDELADDEGLDEDTKEFLSGKASHTETILSNPDRIEAVCRDMVSHYLANVFPLGQKAQVVAFNQRLVVAYAETIQRILAEHSAVLAIKTGDGSSTVEPLEVAVVMSVPNSKQTPKNYLKYALTEDQEEALKRRFKNVNDPLAFVVVTAKWMVGFNAPIEGVLYLDKPLKAANLFQTITRPNRPWKNPVTGQRKKFGRVVDYIGLAKQIGLAVTGPKMADDDDDEPTPVDVLDINQLTVKFLTDLTRVQSVFAGIDKTQADFHSLSEAEGRIHEDSPARTAFVADFIALQGVWEFLYAHNTQNPMLDPYKADYRWLAKVFDYISPTDKSQAILWEKYGAKTLALVHGHIDNLTITPGRTVRLDAAGLELVKKIAAQLTIPGTTQDPKDPGEVYKQVLDSIENRLKHRIEGTQPGVYKSLADRIEKLRQRAITTVDDSIAFLEDCLNVARDVVAADRASETTATDSGSEGNDTGQPLYDPKTGALTTIVRENTPEGLHKIVPDFVFTVDSIVVEVAYTGWAENDKGDKAVKKEIRSSLKKYGLPVTGDLFDQVYAYVRENY